MTFFCQLLVYSFIKKVNKYWLLNSCFFLLLSKDVTISIKGPQSPYKNIYSIGTTVQFLAHPQPDSEAKNTRYEWFVHANDGANHNKSIFKADIPSHKYQFRVAGR